MGVSLRPAARGEIGDERRAYVGAAATAVLEKEERDLVESRKFGAIDDQAALALARHQTRAGKYGQVL